MWHRDPFNAYNKDLNVLNLTFLLYLLKVVKLCTKDTKIRHIIPIWDSLTVKDSGNRHDMSGLCFEFIPQPNFLFDLQFMFEGFWYVTKLCKLPRRSYFVFVWMQCAVGYFIELVLSWNYSTQYNVSSRSLSKFFGNLTLFWLLKRFHENSTRLKSMLFSKTTGLRMNLQIPFVV